MQTAQPRVAVVILNYNGRRHLETFLPSLYQTSYPSWDLYVADNGSTDDSLDFLRQQGFAPKGAQEAADFGKYLIAMDKNHGFAGGYNQALKQVDTELLVLLNSDVEVSPDWLQPLVACLQGEKIAACQPKILSYADKTSFEYAGAGGGLLDKWGYPFCRGRIFTHLETDQGQYDDQTEIFWASGAALAVKKSAFELVGGFDEDYFAHMEEIDLCWRLQLAGYQIFHCGKSWVYHLGGGTLDSSNPRKTYLNFRNSLFTLLKNKKGLASALWTVWVRLVLDGAAGAKFLLAGQFGNLWAIVKAHWAFFLGFFSYLGKRKKVQALAQAKEPSLYPYSIVYQHFIKKINSYKNLP